MLPGSLAAAIALGIRAVNNIDRHDDSPERSPQLIAIIADMLRSALDWESLQCDLGLNCSEGPSGKPTDVPYASKRRKRPKSLD